MIQDVSKWSAKEVKEELYRGAISIKKTGNKVSDKKAELVEEYLSVNNENSLASYIASISGDLEVDTNWYYCGKLWLYRVYEGKDTDDDSNVNTNNDSKKDSCTDIYDNLDTHLCEKEDIGVETSNNVVNIGKIIPYDDSKLMNMDNSRIDKISVKKICNQRHISANWVKTKDMVENDDLIMERNMLLT